MKFEIILLAIALLGLICLVFWAFKTEFRLKKFFLGKKAKDLEDTILEIERGLQALAKREQDLEKEMSIVNAKLKKSIRGLETVRFNPFPDQGSNQSFAVGLLNEDGDGVVISSLYSRERMSVFAKPVKGGASTYELSEEEKEVLNKAKV